jgi:hypothetical protein
MAVTSNNLFWLQSSRVVTLQSIRNKLTSTIIIIIIKNNLPPHLSHLLTIPISRVLWLLKSCSPPPPSIALHRPPILVFPFFQIPPSIAHIMRNVTTFQNHWVCGLYPSSGILNTKKYDVSETVRVSLLGWGEGIALVRPLERALAIEVSPF